MMTGIEIAEMEAQRAWEQQPIKDSVVEALQEYAQNRRPVGDFLYAVLCNDLKAACMRADSGNQKLIWQITCYCYNDLPALCWGSPVKVEAWLNAND